MFNGLILAGGKSSRMGRDKSGLIYHQISQRQYLYNLLKPLCKEVFISCRQEQAEVWKDDLPYLFDNLENKGVLAGIYRAFGHNPNIAWLIIACDLPFVDQSILEYLIKNRQKTKIATAFFNRKQEPEPLLGLWESKSYEIIKKAINENKLSPRKILENNDVNLIACPNEKYLSNINYYQDYLKITDNAK